MLGMITKPHGKAWLLASAAVLALIATTPAFAQDAAPKTPNPAPSPAAAPTPAAVPHSMAQDFTSALKSAYDTNPRIKTQRKALENLDEGVSQAISGWRPTVSATYSKGRQRVSSSGADWSSGDTEDRVLNVEQPLFRGGGTVARTESADERVTAGRFALTNMEQQVLLDAVTAYMDVVRNLSVRDLSKNNEEVLKKQLQASRDRFDVGEVTRTDVAQSEARLARAESDAIQAEGNLAASRATFERVIGFKPENPQPPTNLPGLPATLDDAVIAAMKDNPLILESNHAQKAAESDVDVAFSSILPEISLIGRMSRSQGDGTTGDLDFDNDSILVNATIPLYQSGAEYSRVRASKSIASQRKFELANNHDSVRQAVIQAWESWQTSISTIEAQQSAISAAEIALDGVKQEQLYGSRTILDVLDAEQELFVARVNLVRAERDRIVAIYNLLATMGQLTVSHLGIETKIYNPEEHYDDVKYQFVGF